MPTLPDPTWQTLLEELFDADMRERWGWRAPTHLRGDALPSASSRVQIDVGGLDVPYFCGVVIVDFGEGTVTCLGIDQKTPADERWSLHPDARWWQRARSMTWPRATS